jgi:hypothetical protein
MGEVLYSTKWVKVLYHEPQHKTQPQHTTTNMSRRHPTLQRLWRGLQPCPQILVLLLPTGPLMARCIRCALATLPSFVWGAKMQPIEKQREGLGFGLRGPSFGWTIQQPTKSWHSWEEGYWGGCTTWAERVGRTLYHCLGRQTEYEKIKKIKKNGLNWLLIDISNTTTNQIHVGVTEERKARRFDWGGARGKRDSIILGAIELGGDKN